MYAPVPLPPRLSRDTASARRRRFPDLIGFFETSVVFIFIFMRLCRELSSAGAERFLSSKVDGEISDAAERQR